MSLNAPRFITPPTDEQERFPYRSVWRSLITETFILIAVTAFTFIFSSQLSQIPAQLLPFIRIGLATLPFILWIFFSLIAEYGVQQPRQHLATVTIITILVANSIGIPIITQIFRVNDWLPLAPAINRIIGYTVTVGITQELIKYLTIRYTVWPNYFRVRLDGIAYGIASGIGYATLLNLHFITQNSSAPSDVIMFRVIANYASNLATGIVIGYSLAEVLFANPSIIFQSLAFLVSAVITGISIPIHAGLVNASLSISSVSAPRPLLGLGFSVMLLAVVSIILSGLIRNADRLEREARTDEEE